MAIIAIMAAMACVLSVFFLPVVRIRGASMAPALTEGDIILAPHIGTPKNGQIIAFWSGNKLLIKRVVAGPGDWVNLTADGILSVNGTEINEPYARNLSGPGDIAMPLQVPDEAWFVLGDDRKTSLDSRHSQVGLVGKDDILGLPALRIWPIKHFGLLR